VRRALARAAALSTALGLVTASTAAAQGSPGVPLGSARLVGEFALAGRVTVAHDVKGERVGQRIGRTWTFTPLCAAGACTTIQLVRRRASGVDTLTLNRIGSGDYSGTGIFYAPLRCAGRTYARGESVPFTITVRITAAALFGSLDVATRISATYTNRSRRNLTRCVHVPGHDAAVYHGHLVPPPSGGVGTS
jgi:hypothetical protein